MTEPEKTSDLLRRAAAAIETPADWSDDEDRELVIDLIERAKELERED